MTIYSLDVLLSRFGTSMLFHVQFCCFLTYIQISQGAGQTAWYSLLFKYFPQFVVIHTVKGFCIVNKAEDVFLELSCFFNDPMMLAISSCFLCLFKIQLEHLEAHSLCTAETAGRILSITLLPCEMSAIVP